MARGQWIVTKKGMRKNTFNLDQVYNKEIIKVIVDSNIFLYDIQGVEY